MTGSKKDSDIERAAKAAAGILVFEGAQALYREWREAMQAKTPTYVPGTTRQQPPVRRAGSGYYYAHSPGNAQTRCRKVLVRVVENGKLVRERLEEQCEAQKVEEGYMDGVGYYRAPGI